jgi:hypothetical protein
MRFIVMARTGRTWDEVNAIYEHPPVSTEQILHPERYFEGDDPQYLTFESDAALSGWNRIYDSVMGEFQLLQFLRAHSSKSGVDPAAAAAGWDGDRIHAWEDPETGRVALTLVSAWDSREDAEEFYAATVATVAARYPDGQPHTAQGKHGESTCMVVGPEAERVYVERWGDLVLYVEGAPSAVDEDGNETDPSMYNLREQTWKTLQRASFEEKMQEAMQKTAGE